MEEQFKQIKNWLGIGSINIFGLPMSGKDTIGVRLAENLGGKFLSSGMIIRAMEQETGQNLSHDGKLIPQNVFLNGSYLISNAKICGNIPSFSHQSADGTAKKTRL